MRVMLEKDGVATSIDLPAPEMEIRRLREKLNVTDPADNTFRVMDLLPDCHAEECLRGQECDLDFLNLLARCYDGMDAYEAEKFNAAAEASHLTELGDLINLTQNVYRYTVASPEHRLGEFGRNSYFDLHLAVPADEAKQKDYLMEAVEFLRTHEGVRTSFGLVYENDREPFLFFDGKHMPAYYDEPEKTGVHLKFAGDAEFLQLPVEQSAIERALARLGPPSPGFCTMELDDGHMGLPEALGPKADIYDLNRFFLDRAMTEAEHHTMRVHIYQVQDDPRRIKFMDHGYTEEHGGIRPEEYKCVFRGDLEASDLDGVFDALNVGARPTTYQGHSLSVSDIVEVEGDGAWFCDSLGWKKLEAFDSSQCQDMDGVRCLMLLPHLPPIETRVIDELDCWQRAVSREGEPALMEITYPFEDNAVIVGNEEARLNGMEGNRRVNTEPYAGPMIIVGDDGMGGFCDLTDEQVEKYDRMFSEPDEDITPEELEPHMQIFGFDVY